MIERSAQHIELPAFKGLVVKDSYWRWPQHNKAGNAIDFLVQVLGLSFNDAMGHIIGSQPPGLGSLAANTTRVRQHYDGNLAQPTASYGDDRCAAIRLQNTMPVRQKPQELYEVNSAKSTMTINFVAV